MSLFFFKRLTYCVAFFAIINTSDRSRSRSSVSSRNSYGCRNEMFCGICIPRVQVQSRKHELEHTERPAPTRQHEL